MRLVRAQPGERASTAPAEKSALPRGGRGHCCALGCPPLSTSQLEPRRRRQGPGRPRAPRSSRIVLQTTLLFAEVCVHHPRDAGTQRRAPRRRGRPERSRWGWESVLSAAGESPRGGRGRGDLGNGVGVEGRAGVAFAHGEKGRPAQGTLAESHLCQSLICKPVGVGFPARAFSWWGGHEEGEDAQSPGRALGLHCPKCLLGHPPPHPRSPPPPADLRNNAGGSVPGGGALSTVESRVPRSRTPPEARLPKSERRGSFTRTVLRTTVNKEQLFAAFDEWDSASYRPHSESSIRYSLRTRGGGGGCWASGPPRWAAPGARGPGPGVCAAASASSPCRSGCRWSQADGCSTGTNVC